MRIVGLRERVEEQLHLLFAIFFVNIARETIVTPRDQLRPRLDRVLAQFFLKQLALQSVPARSASASASSFGHGAFCRLSSIVPSLLKSDRLLEQILDLGHAIVDALLIEIENFVGRFQVSQQNIVIERGAVLRG